MQLKLIRLSVEQVRKGGRRRCINSLHAVKQVASLASWAARTQHATNFSAFLWRCRLVASKQLQQPRAKKKTQKLTPPESAAHKRSFSLNLISFCTKIHSKSKYKYLQNIYILYSHPIKLVSTLKEFTTHRF